MNTLNLLQRKQWYALRAHISVAAGVCLLTILLTILLTTMTGVCSAQNRTLDSLNAALAAAKDDTIRIKTLRFMHDVYWKLGQFDTALYCHKQALFIAEQLDDKYWYGRALNSIAEHYGIRGYYDSSFFYSTKLFQVAQQSENIVLLRLFYGNRFTTYNSLGYADKAMVSMRMALKYAQMLNDSGSIAWIFANTALLLREQQQYDSALLYAQKSLEIRKNLQDTGNWGRSMVGIAETLILQQKFQEAQPYLDSGIAYLRSALRYQASLSRACRLYSIVLVPNSFLCFPEPLK